MSAPVRFTSSTLPARERGIELGERFAAEIAATAATYRRLFVTRAGSRGFDVDLWSERAWETISRVAPEHAEEIAGIAEGAGRPVRELASINARTELLVAANPTGVQECSSVISVPGSGAPFAVQTWDWYDAMADGWFHWSFEHEDGRTVETVTEYGMLGKIGVNGYGVGVMLNMLHHADDAAAVATGEVGYPVHLLSRRILDDARSFDDAWKIVQEQTSASTSLSVVDRTGAGATFELFPHGPGRRDVEPVGDGALLVRTNHFVSPEGEAGCLAATISDSSPMRRDKLLATFKDAPPATPGEVFAAMTDHEPPGQVGGICCHPDTSMDPVLWHRTLATVAIDVMGSSLDARKDGPCGHRQHPAATVTAGV